MYTKVISFHHSGAQEGTDLIHTKKHLLSSRVPLVLTKEQT
jgi:hypothetical protein